MKHIEGISTVASVAVRSGEGSLRTGPDSADTRPVSAGAPLAANTFAYQPMSPSTRLAIAIAAAALFALFFLPLWSITLEAPQYPEGIGLYIHLDTITGHKANDLNNINGLNHYIGMKEIRPESIPELDIMPWAIAGIAILGLIAALTGWRWMLYLWALVFLAIAVFGLVDFYLWEYDYGHNLNPKAAIKVPGMSYQPPLIGAKKLLNFTAHSWPAPGGWIAFLSLFTGLICAAREFRLGRKHKATDAS